MSIDFKKYQSSDAKDLANFLSSQSWSFHRESTCTIESVNEKTESGYYDKEGVETFWIEVDEEKVGFIRIYDLDDDTPLFDIRISEKMQGKGIGTATLNWLSKYIFENCPKINRIEGYTRIDNQGMRKVFQKAGFVKESQPRSSWPDDQGNLHDCVGYAILKTDWEENRITPVKWEED